MASVNILQAPVARFRTARLHAFAWAVPVLLLVALLAINPVGYIGGGGDDWEYLEAARCAVREGLCLPHTHWAARFPLILPMALSIRALGESAFSVQLAPFLYAVAGLILLTLNVQRRFGALAAILAGAIFAATPEVTGRTLQPMVDAAEFAWAMAALLALQFAVERGSGKCAALAGACLALAILSRTTSLMLLPLLGIVWLMLPRPARWLALPFGAGLAGALAAEALAYAIATGDPFYSWRLMLGHTRIPSSELAATVDTTRSPLLNLDFIRGWRREMDVHVHWTVDPLLNLLADPRCGLTLVSALALALAYRGAWRADRRLPLLCGLASLHFVLLTYVLAVDPKPRMFWIEYAVAALVIAVLAPHAWRRGSKLLPAILLALLLGRALLLVYDRPNPARYGALAGAWAGEFGATGLATDDWTRRTLTLVPEIAALPLESQAPGRPRLILAQGTCPPGKVLRTGRIERAEWAPLGWARAHAILLGPRPQPVLCLVEAAPQ